MRCCLNTKVIITDSASNILYKAVSALKHTGCLELPELPAILNRSSQMLPSILQLAISNLSLSQTLKPLDFLLRL